MKTYHRIGLTLVVILACVVSFALPVEAREPRHQERGGKSYQADHARKHHAHREPRHHERRYVIRHHHAPVRHVPVVVRNQRYFFLDGLFYRQGLYGFISVPAPIGAVVVSLPIGSCQVVIGGTRYHVYGGVYYRQVPSGYEVVRKPYLGNAYCTPGKEYEESTQVIVLAHILNVREGPGETHPVIRQVHRNNLLKVIGRAPGWLYVCVPGGGYGWVMMDYVTPVESCAKG
ncbi:MAG: DUF6515 family protein [Desulfomonilia bacterium]